MKDKQIHFNCPVEASLSLIGGKYKPLILWHLIDQPLHYMELQRLIPNATPKMLLPPLVKALSQFWMLYANGEKTILTDWM